MCEVVVKESIVETSIIEGVNSRVERSVMTINDKELCNHGYCMAYKSITPNRALRVDHKYF